MDNPKPLTNLTQVRKGEKLWYLPYSKPWHPRAPEWEIVIGAGPKWVTLSNGRRFNVATGLEDSRRGQGGDLFLTEEDALTYAANEMEIAALRLNLIDTLNSADLPTLRSIANFINNGAETNG